MSTEIRVPALGESVSQATVAKWFKAVGEAIAVDEPLVELETDKVTVEVNATAAGVLSEITVDVGSDVAVGAVLGLIGDGVGAAAAPAKPAAAPAPVAPPAPTPAATPPAPSAGTPSAAAAATGLSPAVRKLVEDNALDASRIPASGKDGRLTKGDVLAYLETAKAAPTPAAPPSAGVIAFPLQHRPPRRRRRRRKASRRARNGFG